MKKLFTVLLLVLAVWTLSGKPPKYIILFIGDGMAVSQRILADEFSRRNGGESLLINTFPVHATTRTCSANSITTDSAAAATAIACGVKTKNGVLGLDPEGKKVVSVAETARDTGRKVGIITTVTINHATPAGFYAHRDSRKKYYEIGLDLMESNFDFFGGGGMAEYAKQSPDLFALAEKKGYRIVFGKEGLASAKKGEKTIAVAGAKGARIPYEIDLPENIPSLAEITEKAIEVLDNDKGFFLMVEGGTIDYAGHGNDAAANIFEVFGLDKAVRKAYAFYKKHPDETLIIITGDHETGGLTMGLAGKKLNPLLLSNQKCSAEAFQTALSAKQKAGEVKSFEDAVPLITEKFGLLFQPGKDPRDPMLLSKQEQQELSQAFGKKKLHIALRAVMSKKAGIGWTTTGHTAVPVLTTSVGAGSEKFAGYIENTDIARNIRKFLQEK